MICSYKSNFSSSSNAARKKLLARNAATPIVGSYKENSEMNFNPLIDYKNNQSVCLDQMSVTCEFCSLLNGWRNPKVSVVYKEFNVQLKFALHSQ